MTPIAFAANLLIVKSIGGYETTSPKIISQTKSSTADDLLQPISAAS
jgi:hypothetical protein